MPNLSFYLKDYTWSSQGCKTTDNGSFRDSVPVVINPAVRLGVNNPNYAKTIKAGGDASSAYSAVFSTIKQIKGTVSATRRISCAPNGFKYATSVGSGYDCGITFTVPPSTVGEANADTMAREQFVQKVSDYMSPVKGGVIIGELAQTTRMLKHPYSTLSRYVSQHLDRCRNSAVTIRRLPQRAMRRERLSKAIADSYLETVFGVLPLIGDINDIYRELNSKPKKSRFKINASGHSVSVSSTKGGEVGSFFMGVFCTNQTVAQTAQDVSVTYWSGYELRTSDQEVPINSRFGLTMSEFLPTVWELIPYSFIVDYFTNANSVIAGYSDYGIRRVYGGVSTKVKTTNTTTRSAISQPGLTGIRASGSCGTEYQRTTLQRTVGFPGISVNEVPWVDFRFRVPSITQWLNLGALALSRASATRETVRTWNL